MVKNKALTLRSGARQGYSPLPLLCNIILEILAGSIRQEKKIKHIKIRAEEVELPLFPDMILNIENSKDYTHTHTPVRANKFSKVAG